MAVYKVLQDIEAEDKLVGPLTLRQFVYAAIAAALIFINFKLFISYDLGIIRWIFILGFSIPIVLFGVLAVPFGRDQPTELWLLSHLKFMLSSRKRIWEQGAPVQAVTITAPKKNGPPLTKNLTQGEVNSRLKALATLLDSRGWAIQSTPLYQPEASQVQDDDRLISSESLPQSAPAVDVQVGDDLLDEQSNATAKRYGELVREVEDQKKKDLADKLKVAKEQPAEAPAQSKAGWGVASLGPTSAPNHGGPIIEPDELAAIDAFEPTGEIPDEIASLDERLKAAEEKLENRHPTFTPASPLTAERQRRAQKRMAMAAQTSRANLVNNGNFSVATIASLANRGGEAEIPM